ncbi:pro-sigmaK processing inhibitor BofA family protein [Paenibacillus sp.]|uniref:pro-sigmaK processing inhibitor BofA family protein n=1 Tax=Paenibacillus sp. TaxID=58172 RepID=UPI002811F6F0|nr:pro-sigmaK processing inhibitor BofA family protein [Paenibacillus sp.]
MLTSIWLWVFVGSILGLAFLTLRRRIGFRWLGVVALNIAIAGILLYFLGLAEPYTHFHLPINMVTVTTVAALGVPGLAALVGLKFLVVV